MTLDEAIENENKIAEENQKIFDTQIVFDDVSISELYCDDTEVIEEHLSNYKKCAEYHDQLTEWLEELKQYRAIGTPDECRAAVEKQKEMIAYCDENDCSDCPYHGCIQKENRCMNDFIADEIVKGGGVNT